MKSPIVLGRRWAGASGIVERAKPGGCDIKPVGEARRCELSGKAFVGRVAFGSPQRLVQKEGQGLEIPLLGLYR